MPSLQSLRNAEALQRLDYQFIRGPQHAGTLKAMVQRLHADESPQLGIDTETTGLDPHVDRVRLIQVGSKDFALIVDLNGWRTEGERQVPWAAQGLKELKALLEGPRPKVLQNAAFDLNFLLGEGVDLGGPLFDTMVAAKIVNNGTGAKNDLGGIVERVLKVPLSKELQKADWAGEISDEMLHYAARDAICLPLLVGPLMEALVTSRTKDNFTLWQLFQLEMAVLRPIALMQWHGFGFDRAGALVLREQLEEEAAALQIVFLEELDAELKRKHPDDPSAWLPREADGSVNTREKDSGSIRLGTKVYAGFNPRSPKQMALRFEQAGILLPPDKKGKPSLDQNLLAFLRKDYALIDRYLTWKTAVTRVSGIETLLESVGPDGRVHAGYRQMGTETGRLSCIAKGQRVSVPNGFKLIEDLEVGDFVYALTGDGSPTIKRVINKWCNGTKELIRICWEAAGHKDPKYGELLCTPDHKVRTDNGWTAAAALVPGQTIWHLRRSVKSPRPRLYYRGRGCTTEQLVIKEHYFGKLGSEWHIHHKDHNPVNNSLDNLEVMSCKDHLAHHGNLAYPHWLFTEEARLKSQQNHTVLHNKDNPNWISLSRFTALRMLATARGRATYVPMDFDTFKRKCAELNIDIKVVASRYSSKGFYLNKRTVVDAYDVCRTIEHSATYLGIGTRKLSALLKLYGISKTNHRVTRIEPAGASLVYDLEIEDVHNFIVEEICVHNCAAPNLQQVNRAEEFRSQFVAAPGHVLVVADFSQIELRVAAELSGEERMLEAYRAGRDLHTETASLMTGVALEDVTKKQRTSAKAANFGLLFGAGPATLRKQAVAQYGIDMTHAEAKEIVESFRTAYPRLYAWQVEEGNKTTKAVTTALGRRRMLVGFNDKYTTRINTQVQGTAGDIAKLAIRGLWAEIKAAPGAKLIAMVHDEIVIEVPEADVDRWSGTLKRCMEEAGAVVCSRVPIVAEVSHGRTWADAK